MSKTFHDPAELVIDSSSLDEPLEFRLDLTSAALLADLAARFGLEALTRFESQGSIGLRHGLTHVKARLSASMAQICAVTLEPFDDSLTLDLETYFVPEGELPQLQDDESMNEPLTADGLADVGEFLLQSFSLALPDIPRKPGLAPLDQSFGPQWELEEKPRPFAALADFKLGAKQSKD
jgi:uncharacterized metal-binding protein YceD (DUF177 family)